MELVEATATVTDLDAFLDRLGAIGRDHGVTVQAFDARYVVGRDHLARAVALADRAIARDENIARERAVEILLYAAGRRQIDRALEMGVSPVDAAATDGDGDGDGDRDGDSDGIDSAGCPAVVLVDKASDPDRAGDPDDASATETVDQDDATAAERAAAADIQAIPALSPAATLDTIDHERVTTFFEVTEAELAATDAPLTALVGERVALLQIGRAHV